MNWNYQCPHCKKWRSVPWSKKGKKYKCHEDEEKTYTPPSPEEQKDAYVNTHEWPDELEKAVINEKGGKCCVPGCKKNYETLDHRKPFSKDGPTSVENLWPMCEEHNLEKGEKNWLEYLNFLSKK